MQAIRNNTWMSSVLAVMITSLLVVSCKKKFEDPPATGEPGVIANKTIKSLKDSLKATGTTYAITEDFIIEGVVNADDRSGNFYQQIAIQDSTGGILLRLAGNNLFNEYPVGRKIYVKLKGLYLGEYGRMIQVGGGVEPGGGGVTLLATNLRDQHILKGALNQPLVPKVVTVAQLGTTLWDPYVNTLVKLQDYQFVATDLSKNYADDDQSGNRIIENCSGQASNRVTVRTSNFANFATLKVAQGKGEITGVYSIFNNTKQWTIRDTMDVKFYGPRCPTAGGGGSITLTASPQTYDFDAIGTSGLPAGVYVKEGATASYVGNEGTVFGGNFSAKTPWNNVSLGYKNFASATGLTAASLPAAQDASANRVLGLRQTGGADAGVAFAFQLANTTGKTNLKLEFLLQSLDGNTGTGRTTTWRVDYGIGDDPGVFTPVATTPATLTTTYGAGMFANTAVTANFGNALDNINQKVWIRIVALNATTGGGNRASTGVDDVRFTWN